MREDEARQSSDEMDNEHLHDGYTQEDVDMIDPDSSPLEKASGGNGYAFWSHQNLQRHNKSLLEQVFRSHLKLDLPGI